MNRAFFVKTNDMTLSVSFKKPNIAALARASETMMRATSVAVLFFLPALFNPAGRQAYWLKIAQCAALFALSFLPRVLGLADSFAAAFFDCFLILAGLGGSVLEGFEKLPFSDNLAHFLSGALCVAIAAQWCKKRGARLSAAAFGAISIGFALAIAAAWEMYEFVVFTILPNRALSISALGAELGFGNAAAASGTIRSSLSLSFATVEGLLKNQFDSFCDILCALVGAAGAAMIHKF